MYFPRPNDSGTLARDLDINDLEKRKGHLYSFKNMKAERLRGEILITNGIAWSSDEETLYFVDSGTCQVYSYQYDKETTEICECVDKN